MPYHYQPHMVCYGGDVWLILTMAVADATIALAYFGISAVLFFLVRWTQPQKTGRLSLGFAAFILLCGIGHLGHMVAIFFANTALLRVIALEFLLTGLVSLITCVKLWFCVPELRELEARLSKSSAVGGQASVLIADDEPLSLELLTEILGDHYTVLAASGGQAAIELAASSKPDLIILDVIMRGMSGYDVYKRLQEQPHTKRIPVIFITGLGDADDEEHGLNLGAVDFITKPINPQTLLARVKNQIRLSQERTKEVPSLRPKTGDTLAQLERMDGIAESILTARG